MQLFTLKIHFNDGHEEVLQFSPQAAPPDKAEIEDFKLRIARGIKDGVLRLIVDEAEMLVFTNSVAYIETMPGAPGPTTFPWAFHRL